jgi:hypothetical protein
MTLDEAIDRYVAVAPEDKCRFLIRLSYELTVQMRGCYDEADVGLRVVKLQGANEIQHHLASEAHHHLVGNIERYPDDVLIRILVENGAFYNIGGELAGALTRCLEQYERRSV